MAMRGRATNEPPSDSGFDTAPDMELPAKVALTSGYNERQVPNRAIFLVYRRCFGGMDRLRDWLRHRTPTSSSAHTATTDEGRRRARADHISRLQADISRLQQERLELSNEGGDQARNEGMARIERELGTAQQELAKLQGRI